MQIHTSVTGRRISVVLADDHDIVRGGIKALLQLMPDVQVIDEARDGEELLAVLARCKPDVVLTDLAMPGLDGLAAIARIHEQYPDLRVLVLSMYDTLDFVRRAVASGASGYLMKDSAPQELEQAVRAVASTGSYFSGTVARLLLHPEETASDDGLTERQIEILVRLASGMSSKEIAYDLGLSSKTVDVHRGRIMERLELRDVASLTRYAVRKGLIKP
ncbi:response regulator transcription factor [Ramlibacter monticola]|uniref:Response regulator transcription factor n=1 Tax=Ramlibacter monticola TaxID=1926872 RepID=A0A936Z0F0_9BURK|nr:response regulator transcription factor [Ramlibacter monticola]MBL0392293.1 response regulator transcription factor [Ramlibacter monticola]